MRYFKSISLLALSWLWVPGARADGLDVPPFYFSGFGTLGAVHSSEHQADFTSSYLKPNGAGASHNWSTDVDSLIAGQLKFQPSSSFSAVVQVISEQLYDDTWRPHVEWANIKYQPTRDVSLRVGRIELPSFMFSDTRKVGYALPWVRLPVEVYHLVPISNSDGADVSYRLHTGGLLQTLTATYGESNPRLPADAGGGSAHGRRMWLVTDTLEYGAATAHIAYQSVNLTVPAFEPLFDGFRNFGPDGDTIADKYAPVNKRAQFYGLGAQYNPGNWFVAGEWGNVNYHSMFGETTGWYVSAGYRWGQVTPYATYSGSEVRSNTTDRGLDATSLPPGSTPTVLELNAGLNALLASAADQDTCGAGARWDFYRNLALKFQYDHMHLGAGSHGLLINAQPGYQRGGVVNLLSATLDFVW